MKRNFEDFKNAPQPLSLKRYKSDLEFNLYQKVLKSVPTITTSPPVVTRNFFSLKEKLFNSMNENRRERFIHYESKKLFYGEERDEEEELVLKKEQEEILIDELEGVEIEDEEKETNDQDGDDEDEEEEEEEYEDEDELEEADEEDEEEETDKPENFFLDEAEEDHNDKEVKDEEKEDKKWEKNNRKIESKDDECKADYKDEKYDDDSNHSDATQSSSESVKSEEPEEETIVKPKRKRILETISEESSDEEDYSKINDEDEIKDEKEEIDEKESPIDDAQAEKNEADEDEEKLEDEDEEVEEEEEEAEEKGDDEDEVEEVEMIDGDDSDDEEIEIVKPRDFFFNEAEVSGSDSSDDEEEEDEMMKELIDEKADALDSEDLRKDVATTYQKELLRDDKRLLLQLQERYLEDGDLHSDQKRAKRFKWKTADSTWLDDARDSSSDDENADDEDDEDDEAENIPVFKLKNTINNSTNSNIEPKINLKLPLIPTKKSTNKSSTIKDFLVRDKKLVDILSTKSNVDKKVLGLKRIKPGSTKSLFDLYR
ncbi:glutamic acid-rich protein-like [Panonychus citri]|uniref:glutamic acid-rich protein-like n=1 Tax=Panonychus citri TaxID=50023 RepID=UPI0023080886|nr:glutamic acid-rich protein-like [Panonychus citri]XP_053206459.1 glutamic acid-rich protein-like [Panonychus citri]